MKIIPESYHDIIRLATMYTENQITADEYYAAVNEWSKVVVDGEIRRASRVRKN